MTAHTRRTHSFSLFNQVGSAANLILKPLTVFTALLLLASPAFADSLESVLAKQTVSTISPVEFSGYAVAANTTDGSTIAQVVCAAVGATRLVSFTTKTIACDKCTYAQPVSGFGTGAAYLRTVKAPIDYHMGLTALDTVTCAK